MKTPRPGGRGWATALLVAASTWGGAVRSAEPPPVERLFGCPLLAEPDAFVPRRSWRRVTLEALGVSLAVPGRWEKTELEGARAELVSDSGRTRVSVRRSRLGGADAARVKRLTEARELGPSHAGERCAASLAERIRGATGFERLLVGIHGRPLAARRRSYAVYVPMGDETVTVVLTIQWPRRARGPDLQVVRRVLGSLAASKG